MTVKRLPTILLLLLAASAVRAENVGLIADSVVAGRENYDNWQRAITRGRTVTVPKGDIYLDPKGDGPLSTPARVSCGRVEVPSAGGYAVKPNPFTGQMATRIIWQDDGPFLRIRGSGFVWDGQAEIIGRGKAACVEVEGRSNPATGRHQINGPHFRNWAVAIRALGGYYERGKFIADENHADNSLAENCETWNCGVFHSLNQQAQNWLFRRWIINQEGEPSTVVAFDIERGGLITAEHIVSCVPLLTVFRVKDYSPNNCYLRLRDFEFDRFPCKSQLTLFEYAGPQFEFNPGFDMGYIKWRVRADGWIAPNDQLEFKRVSVPEFMQQKAKPIDTSDVVWEGK